MSSLTDGNFHQALSLNSTTHASNRFKSSITDYAEIRFGHFLRTRLSADDRQIAMQNAVFEVFSALFQYPEVLHLPQQAGPVWY
ncbi:hypothetical protein [Undibacterium luofuense]|uniref:hypothetical protein n=1 Tax=Undibacterium luofuense TaxID=2828733 RepID=UPI001BAEC91F|nr:hypothetical protein [Undibacterium luofuense]